MTINRLDLVSKLYQPTVFPRVSRVARGERSAGPTVIDLDPTTFCDLACPECISGKLLNQGRFTPERLSSLAHEIVDLGVRAVILIGGGEPLAHRGTRTVIDILGAAGIAIGVVTNGTMIDQNIEQLARYASWVRVSMDAATSGTYRIFRPDRRGGSAFEKVVGNMREFARRKTGMLGYSFLVIVRKETDGSVVSNHDEVLAAAELARDIGCDYFEVKAVFDEQHFVVELPERILCSIESQLERAHKLTGPGFEVISSSTLESLRRGAGSTQPKAYRRCGVAELRTLVTPSGVYVCPYHRGNRAAMLGDAVTDSLVDIWRAADRAIVDPSRDCAFHCARHDSNLELAEIAAGRGRPVGDVDHDPFI